MRPALRHPGRRNRAAWPRRAAFTLVEMILAVGIAVGLLVVAITFYRQVTDLRAQILEAAGRNAAVRLVLDRMAADLRTAGPGGTWGDPFVGTADSMAFTRLGAPGETAPAGAGAGLPGGGFGGDEIVRVAFAARQGNDGTNRVVIGFDRRESAPWAAGPAGETGGTGMEAPGTGAVTNRPVSAGEPLTDAIRFVRFRYWDGGAWREGWTNGLPPAGVEVVLGREPLPPESTPEEYPYEQFRRVIVVPAGLAAGQATTTASDTPGLPVAP